MTYPMNEVLFEQEEFQIKKFENRRFTVLQDGKIFNTYSTFGAAKLVITQNIRLRNYTGKKMGEK